MNLTGWAFFWTVWLIIAGASFAVITGVVSVLGFRDLKNLFHMLRDRENGE